MTELESTRQPGWRGIQLPFQVRIEPRLEIPRWLSPLVSLGAIVFALLLGALVLAIVGGDPWRAYAHIAGAAFGDLGVLSEMAARVELSMVA